MRISDWSSDVCSSDLWITWYCLSKSNSFLFVLPMSNTAIQGIILNIATPAGTPVNRLQSGGLCGSPPFPDQLPSNSQFTEQAQWVQRTTGSSHRFLKQRPDLGPDTLMQNLLSAPPLISNLGLFQL